MDLLTSLLKKTHLSSSADIGRQIDRPTAQRTSQDLLQFQFTKLVECYLYSTRTRRQTEYLDKIRFGSDTALILPTLQFSTRAEKLESYQSGAEKLSNVLRN
jgi:hypothetical protein